VTTVDGGPSDEAAAGGDPGGIDSGSASSGSVGGIGGATSTRGGAAGAGGGGSQGGHAGASNGGASGAAATPALYFSEYVEGSSSNKALEIAATAHSVLDGCKVGAYFNGSGEASVVATLSGVLETGQVLTLCTSTLQTQLGAACAQVGRLTFNGNDAIALACDGKILDVIGQIGVDPGTAWGTGSITTIDHTLRRKCTISVGDPTGLNAFDPSLEWDSFPIDTFNGLGVRGC
jgi:predicted extracellular nuclease